ncbi:MAG: hypothetical protein EP329_00310 [Deltaproteobacteria bacterium]|nr:MAG: hypothetical protein EP329_00310 [Deltaproteobacteria bacterium]
MLTALALAGCPSDAPSGGDDADVVDHDTAADAVDDTAAADTLDGQDVLDDTAADDTIADDTLGDDTTVADTGPTDTSVADTGDSDTTAPDTVEPVIARLNAVVWEPDALYDYADLYVHGVFSELLGALDVIDPAGWLAAWHGAPSYVADDYWPIPKELDTPVAVSDDGGGDFDDDTLDAGAFFVLGDAAAGLDAALVEGGGPRVYASALEDGFLLAQGEIDGPLDLRVDGGADVPALTLEGVTALPAPFGFTSHDVASVLPVRYGQPLDFTWTAPSDVGAGDALLVLAESDASLRVARVEDDGALSLDAIFPGLHTQGGLTSVAFERLRDVTVDTAAGPVRITTARKQWFYPQAVGAWDLAPTAAGVGRTVSGRLRLFDVSASAAVTLDLGDGVTVSDVTLEDSVGHVVRFTAEVAVGAASGPRTLTVRDGDVTLLAAPAAFWVTRPFESAGDCASTLDEGALPNGTWAFTDDGLAASEFSPGDCPSFAPGGREQVIPVSLVAGERLTARLWAQDSRAALYLADGCGGTAWGCKIASAKGRAAELELVADEDMELLLVADSHQALDGPAQDMRLDLRRTAPLPAVVVPTGVTGGASAVLVELYATGGFVAPADPTAYAFSGGVETVSVEVIEEGWVELELSTPNVSAPAVVDLVVTADGQTYSSPGVLTLQPYVVGALDCAAADAMAPIPAGHFEVLALETGMVDQSPCGDFEAIGAIVPVALGPGETLHATVSGPGLDARVQLLLSCDDPTVAARCADDGLDDWPEYVTWTGPDTPSTVYLVVEAFDDSLAATLDLTLEITP